MAVYFGKQFFDDIEKKQKDRDPLTSICFIIAILMVLICAQRASIVGFVFAMTLMAMRGANTLGRNIYTISFISISSLFLIYIASNLYSSSFLYRLDYKFSDFFYGNSDLLRLESIFAGLDAFLSNPFIGAAYSEINSVISPHNAFVNGLAHFGIFYLVVISYIFYLWHNLIKINFWSIFPISLCFFTLMTHSSIPFYNDVNFSLIILLIYIFNEDRKKQDFVK